MNRRCLLTALFCAVYVCSFAQQVFFKSYTVQDGLVANPVRCIYQDNKGFIWIGTFEGLSRYDGYKFTSYTTSNGLSHDFINGFYEVNNKLLIAENNGAVDVIENNSIKKQFVLGSAVNTIMTLGKHLFLSTDISGLYQYKNDTIIHPDQQMLGLALGPFTDYNDSLVICEGVDDNIVFFRKDLTVQQTVKNLGTHFYFLFRDTKKRLWTGTSNGLKLLPPSVKENQPFAFAPLPAPFDIAVLHNSQVTCMIEEKEGIFWIGTTKGLLHLFADGTYQLFNEKDGLPSSDISTVYKDKENNLWIGTSLGLAKWVSKNNVIFFNNEKKAFKNDILSIQALPGKKFILNSVHGVQQFYYATKEFENVSGRTNKWYCPISGSWPLLLYGSAGTISVLDETKNELRLVQKLEQAVPDVYNACNHPSGTIFLGARVGLFALNNGSIQKILTHRVTCITTDSNGFIWAGTWTNGLFRIEIKTGDSISYNVQNVTALTGQNEIRSIYKDSKKNIWIGTRYGGVFCVQQKGNGYETRHFSRESGLMSNWVKSIAELKNGDMWIGTYLGIDRLVNETGGFRVFNFSKATNFFAQIENIVPAEDNNWICVANTGIAYFHDEGLHKTPPLPASILSISLGVLENKLTVIEPREKISLHHDQNAARFEFSALGFYNEKQVLYSYRLKGSGDTSWSKPENIHEASYESLPPGHYTFQVRTIGWNGKEGLPASFSFIIKTPFWKQWWFLGLCAFFMALLFYLLYQYRIRQLLRVQKVRNRIATDLHDDIGSTLTNISILSELGNKNLSQPEKAQPFLVRISEEVQASSQAMDDIIWSVNSHNDSLPETMARMRRFAAELFDNTNVNCHLQLDERGHRKLSMEQRRDVYLIYKEALNNIHKHAAASNVWIEVFQNQNYLHMHIRDDGKGFDTSFVTHRNGLKNLRARVHKWKGEISVESSPPKGTAIELKLPLKD